MSRFRAIWGESFVLKIHSGGRPSILHEVCFSKNITLSGINNHLRVIRARAQFPWSPDGPFKSDLSFIFCAQNSFWRPSINPTWSLHLEKYYSLGDKQSSPSNKRQSEISMVARWAVLEWLELYLLCSKFILEAVHQSSMKFASRKILLSRG